MGKFSQSFPSVLMPGYQVITILVALLVTIAVTASKAEEHKINTLYGRKLHGDSQLLRVSLKSSITTFAMQCKY